MREGGPGVPITAKVRSRCRERTNFTYRYGFRLPYRADTSSAVRALSYAST